MRIFRFGGFSRAKGDEFLGLVSKKGRTQAAPEGVYFRAQNGTVGSGAAHFHYGLGEEHRVLAGFPFVIRAHPQLFFFSGYFHGFSLGPCIPSDRFEHTLGGHGEKDFGNTSRVMGFPRARPRASASHALDGGTPTT